MGHFLKSDFVTLNFIMGFQHHANIYKNLNDPIPGKRRDRQQNGQTLFHKTLLATDVADYFTFPQIDCHSHNKPEKNDHPLVITVIIN